MTDTTPNDGGPAFPTIIDTGQTTEEVDVEARSISAYPEHIHCLGMTLRDWFAGQALAGMANDYQLEMSFETHIAIRCYGLADAMLVVRERRAGQ